MSNPTSPQGQDLHGEVYCPAPEFVAQANVPDPGAVYDEAQKDLEGYWARRAGELEWYKKWGQSPNRRKLSS